MTSRNEPENVSSLTRSQIIGGRVELAKRQTFLSLSLDIDVVECFQRILANIHLILLGLGGDKVPVGQADRSQAVLCHWLNHGLDQPEKTV